MAVRGRGVAPNTSTHPPPHPCINVDKGHTSSPVSALGRAKRNLTGVGAGRDFFIEGLASLCFGVGESEITWL